MAQLKLWILILVSSLFLYELLETRSQVAVTRVIPIPHRNVLHYKCTFSALSNFQMGSSRYLETYTQLVDSQGIRDGFLFNL